MADTHAQRLGRTLAALRTNLGLTQATMAAAAGLATSTYARHEQGHEEPTAKVLERYMRELGLKPSEFYRVHESLLLARARHAEGPGWWMALENELADFTREDEAVREKLGQYSELQAEIFEVVLSRLRP